ncbi:FabD/lysophospholipase-like protein [Gigaspora margarita]|uniref:[acyl-carrier-protein] S-malonyltransferase n=1 Tax=Gigaspora margarita TaxID=4874 RepID=A0A8H3XDK3_GIGMA|nr:FabD/lysophospholipase-like protein [Gigaspora margarita]
MFTFALFRTHSRSLNFSSFQVSQIRTAMLRVHGQGAQYVGMGKDLYSNYPLARQVFEEADDALGSSLTKLVFEGHQKDLTQTQNAQPAILTTSIATLRVLESEYGFDVSSACTYALGHSLGEYTALVATQSLSLRDAVKLVRLRGEAMADTVSQLGVRTAMAALIVREENLDKLETSIDEICSTLPEGESVELANINSSFQAVISGTGQAVDYASRVLQSQHLAARALDLPVSAPFHCRLMQRAANIMKKAMSDIKFKKPIVDVISNVTANPIQSASEIPSLLVQQVTATVQWHKSVRYCKENEINNFILFGPARVLANLLKKDYPLDYVRPFTTVEDIQSHIDYLKIKQTNNTNC